MSYEQIQGIRKCQTPTTTQRADYVQHDQVSIKKANQTTATKQLPKPNKMNDIFKTWTTDSQISNDYMEYLKVLKKCHPARFSKHFKYPSVKFYLINEMLRDHRKTEYASRYSPNYYYALRRKKADHLDHYRDKFGSDNRTTYALSYNPIKHFDNYKKKVHYLMEKYAEDLKSSDIYEKKFELFKKYVPSTYYDELCMPALQNAKDHVMPTGPIDRYTMRRI